MGESRTRRLVGTRDPEMGRIFWGTSTDCPTSGEATISVDLSQRESTKRQLFETLSGCHEPCFDSRHLT